MDAAKVIKLYQGVIKDQIDDKLSIVQAATRISRMSRPKTGVHPMLWVVQDLAYKVADDCGYLSKQEQEELWNTIIGLVTDYEAGKWRDTTWSLAATYVVKQGDNVVKGYSLIVKRQNGKTEVETSPKDLLRAVKKLVSNISVNQTDEWYLRNIAALLPNKVGDKELEGSDVRAYLMDNYPN